MPRCQGFVDLLRDVGCGQVGFHFGRTVADTFATLVAGGRTRRLTGGYWPRLFIRVAHYNHQIHVTVSSWRKLMTFSYVISRRQHFRCHFWVQFEHPRLNSKDGTQDLESTFEPPSAYHNLNIYKLPIFHISSYFCRNLQSFLYLPGWFIPEILDPSRAWLGKKKLTGTTIHGNLRGPPLPRKGWWWLIVP